MATESTELQNNAESNNTLSDEAGKTGMPVRPPEPGSVGDAQPVPSIDASYTDDEEEAIQTRLRGLGYIE